jgi:hypothetical protein
MTKDSPPAHPAPRLGGLYRQLGLSVVAPLLAIELLLHRGASATTAYVAAAVFPLAEIAWEAAVTRRVGILPAISLVAIVAGLALALVTGDARFAILKDSVFTFLFGLVFLGSLAGPRPLIFSLNQDLAQDDAARAGFEAIWERPAGRRSFRLMTFVWGAGLVAEAVARVVAVLLLPLGAAAALSPVLAVVAIGGLTLWTVLYVRARRRAAATG